MVKRISIAAIVACGLLAGCSDNRSKACARFTGVCDELDKHSEVNAIITTSLEADKGLIKQWLYDNDIELLQEFDATDQMLLKIDESDFVALSQRDDIENIQKDKFYPR